MSVRILFFSLLRDITRQEEVDFPLPEESLSVKGLLARLFDQYEGLREWDDKLLIAVNCEYASRDEMVKSGDEVAIMPPVQGG